jgi:hypothetical protein
LYLTAFSFKALKILIVLYSKAPLIFRYGYRYFRLFF